MSLDCQFNRVPCVYGEKRVIEGVSIGWLAKFELRYDIDNHDIDTYSESRKYLDIYREQLLRIYCMYVFEILLIL